MFCTEAAAIAAGLAPPRARAKAPAGGDACTASSVPGAATVAAAAGSLAAPPARAATTAPGTPGPARAAHGAVASTGATSHSPTPTGCGVLDPLHKPSTAVLVTSLFSAQRDGPGWPLGRQEPVAVDRPHTGEHAYAFVNVFFDYRGRPLNLLSRHDGKRVLCTEQQRAHTFAVQLSRARAYHSNLTQTWHPEIPFARDTGEQICVEGIFLAWVAVRRTAPPQELDNHVIYHRLAHHDIKWCGILINPPVAFHPGPPPIARDDDDDPPNDPDPEPPGPGWYERARYTPTEFGTGGGRQFLLPHWEIRNPWWAGVGTGEAPTKDIWVSSIIT